MRFSLLFLAVLLTFASPALAREWTTRDGKGTLEAELIDADETHVVLKRAADGKLFRVPLARLSLGDVQYIREAMQAAGLVDEPKKSVSPPAAVDEKPAATRRPRSTRSGPPLADPAETGWQAAPDPAPIDWTLAKDAKLRIAIPGRNPREDCVFPITGGPFVALGANERGNARELWDLRTARKTGEIREELMSVNKAALSPDGRHIAMTSNRQPGVISVWSFASGKPVQELKLEQQFSSVYGLDFAGNDRIVASLPIEKGFVVWDIKRGERLSKIDFYPSPMMDRYTLSAGGNYLAVQKDDRIRIHDLRNGALAGDLALTSADRGRVNNLSGLGFSDDGREFAVLAGRHPKVTLVCWSMETGEELVSHELSDELPRSSSAPTKTRAATIQWIPGGRGWLVLERALVDREKGGPIWVADDKPYDLPLRRIVDADRMLVTTGDNDARVLELAAIPWNRIAEAERIVTSGGSVEDVGLPDVTLADRSEARPVGLSPSPTGPYDPQTTEPLADSGGRVRHTLRGWQFKRALFAAPQAQSVLISGDTQDPTQYRADLAMAAGMTADVFDLKSGRRESRFELPFVTELIDFGPDGRLAVYRDVKAKDRIDIFDVRAKQHVVAFRPYQGQGEQFQRQVTWAALLDSERLLTLSQGGELVLWSLPDCRAEYTLPLGPFRVTLAPSRRYFAVGSGGALFVVDTRTGETCRRFDLPPMSGTQVITSTAFRADGQRIAGLVFEGDRSRLVAWDANDPAAICDIPLPFQTFQVHWSGPDHVVMDTRLETTRQQMTLVDVPQARVVWKYNRPIGSTLVDAPDDRLWSLMPDAGGSRSLMALELPDDKAAAIIAETPAPEPLFGPGARVALNVKIGGMPDDLEDRRRREDALLKELREYFESQLEARGVLLDDEAPTTFSATIKNLTEEDIVVFRTRYATRVSAAVLIATRTLHAELSVETDDDLVLWFEEKFVNSGDVNVGRPPRNMSRLTYARLQQWDAARRWAQETYIPKTLFHPDAYLGAGESTISATGIK